MARYIPYLFHQTWKTRHLPCQLKRWRQSWLKYHPDYAHWLWTDKDNLAFLKKHYAWFVPTYQMYPENIMRVDAIRCFILYHFGGIYVDLDFECLRAIDTLIEDKHCVLGTEPASHGGTPVASGEQKPIVCNAFIAAAPRHPFIMHVIQHMSRRGSVEALAQDPNAVLQSTGPMLMTEAWASYPNQQEISIESDRCLYPVTKDESLVERSQWNLDDAYAIHHWKGTWWRGKNIQRLFKRIFWNMKHGR